MANEITLEKFFDKSTMSVHIRENTVPTAKKGAPGEWKLVGIGKKKLSPAEVESIAKEIIDATESRDDGFIEIEREGSSIIQLSNYRIVITRPPFSDGWEITAVRPVKKLTFDDYDVDEKLRERIANKAEGILIAGSPGMGKSTFAQALAMFYLSQNKVVKTVEAPRDLNLPDSITQYAISHGDAQEIHDILLLSRPDYTIFDEMRNTDDFKLFADLRLSGVGMVGVVHATKPIDAIQRFVGRIELGVIPQIIDTVIFIKDGKIDKVLRLAMTVKVPSGMTEADLARPVVVVSDFTTREPEYELYSYGEETVVVPVSKAASKSPALELASRQIENYFKRYSRNVEAEVVSENKCIVRVDKSAISEIIGKQGRNIDKIEKELGMSIDIQEIGAVSSEGEMIEYTTKITKKSIVFYVEKKALNRDVDILIGGDYLLTAKVGSGGTIKIKKNNKIGRIISQALTAGEEVSLIVK